MRYLRQNTATIVTVGPFYDKTDGVTIETALTITNERISMTVDANDGSAPTLVLDNVTGATSGTSNDLNYIANNDAGLMQIELAAANVNYLGRAMLSITDAANHVPVFHEFTILPAVIYDAMIAGTDLFDVSVTQIAGSAVDAAAAQLGVNVVNWKGSAAAAMTGDAYARLGAPAGASVSADVAAVKSDTGAVKTKTDYLPSATAGAAGGVFIAGSNAATSVTTALTANITGNLSGSVGSVTGAVGSVTGAVGSVTGAVGSVTGNVGGSVASVAANGITATSIAADAINAAAVKADAVTKIQNGLATPTNITAGTITTVTNLTNAPTAGDLTATMKTSVTTAATAATPTAAAVTGAVGSVTGAVGSVTGNVGGNVTGSVGSVTGAVGSVTSPVTAGTVSDKTGYALSSAGVQAIWDALTSALTTAGSIGKLLVDNINATIGSRSTYAGADTAGTTTLLSRIVGTLATGTHNPQTGDAYARLGAPAGASVSADVAAVKADTAAIGALNNLSAAQAQTAAAAALTAYDPPTNAEMEARTLAAASYATATALAAVDDFVDTEVAAIKGVTDKLDTALVQDGAVYQLTANALELAPTGGSAPTAVAIRQEIDSNSTKLAAIVEDTGTTLPAQIAASGTVSITAV